MSDQTREPTTDPTHQFARERFDAIYSFVEKQSTIMTPTPQRSQHQAQTQAQAQAQTQQQQDTNLKQPQKQQDRTTSLKIRRFRLPDSKSKRKGSLSTTDTADETELLPDPRMLQERYHTMILPDKQTLREHSRAWGLPIADELQELDEDKHVSDAEQLPVDMLATLKMPVVQVKRLDFLRDEPLFQPVGGMGNVGGLIDDDPDIDKYDTIPMLVLKDIAKQQGQAAPEMQSEITGAAGNAAIVGVGNIAGNILKYGSNLMIQRGFGPAVYGIYSISYALVSLIAALFNLGLDDAMVRYTATYRTKKKMQALGGLTIFCTVTAGLAGLLGAFLVIFYAPALANFRHDTRMTPVLVFMAPLIPMLCMQIMWYSGLQGLKAFKWRVLAERVVSPVVMVAVLIVILFIQHNVIGVVIATLVGIAASMIFSLYALLRLLPPAAKRGRKEYELREWLNFAVPNFLTSIVDMTLESTDTLLLAFFAISNEQIGLYTAAIKLSGFIVMPQTSLNSMFAPTIAELHTKGEHEKLAAMFKIVTKWSITLSLPIFFTVSLFSRPILAISSHGFVEAWPLLIAFALGNIINTSTGAVGYLLMMTGYQKVSVFNSITAVVVNVAVGVLLAPRYGAMGVAVSTGLAIGVVNVMKLAQVIFILKIHPYNLSTLKPVLAGVISAAITGALIYLLDIHHINLLIQLLLIPVFLILYGAFILLFKLGQEDQVIIDALNKKLKRKKK